MPGTRTRLTTLTIAFALSAAAIAVPDTAHQVAAQGVACIGESEPNDTLESASRVAGALCTTGTLPDNDQDLLLWEVRPVDSLLPWTFTVTGVPRTITSIHLFPVTSPIGAPLDAGGELMRIDSSAEDATPGVRADVALPAGRYVLGVSRGFPVRGGMPTDLGYRVAVEPTTALPASADTEPNDDRATAGLVAGGFHVSGDLRGSADHFAWTLTADDATRLWDAEVRVPAGATASLAVHGPDGELLASSQAAADGYARLHDLGLPAGRYDLVVSPAAGADLPYLLSATEVTSAFADPEPNDTAARATPLDPATSSVRGRLAAHADRDIVRLPVDATRAASQQDILLVSSGGLSHQVCLAGVVVQCRSGVNEVRLSNLSLPVGDLLIEVTGEASLDVGYELHLVSVGPASPSREIEPNDSAMTAAPLAPDTIVTGRGDDTDSDFFQAVTSGEPQLWRLEADGTAIKDLDWIALDGRPLAAGDISSDETHAVLRDLALDPGRHWFSVRSTGGEYALRLIPMGSPDPDAEREPNDDSSLAGSLAIDHPRIGRLVMGRDVDVYRFSLAAREHVRLQLTPPADGAAKVELWSDGSSLLSSTEPVIGAYVAHDLVLDPGDYEIWLRPDPVSESWYSLAVTRMDPFLPTTGDVPLVAAVEPSITTATPDIAAYWPSGQGIAVELTLANTGTRPESVSLDAVTSHHAWSVVMERSAVDLPAGSTLVVPLRVIAPADAIAEVPVRVTVRARDAVGGQRTTSLELTPRVRAVPVDPMQVWPVPDELLGGLDVASLALGATPVARYDSVMEGLLHDGLAVSGSGLVMATSGEPITLDVDLAGDTTVEIAGFMLDPVAGEGALAEVPRSFTISVSDDGAAWSTVLTGELSPLRAEQAFVLESPVTARFAQLVIESTHALDMRRVALGEWKVIAPPGIAPAPTPLDLADPALGGHVVRVSPLAPDPQTAEGLLSADLTAWRPNLGGASAIEWVVGFADDRAAQVERVEWLDPVASDPLQQMAGVSVDVSLDSPLGPWQPLGGGALVRAQDGSMAPLMLEAPTWARFIRFTGLPPASASHTWELPGAIHVLERPTDGTYRSILGQWGAAKSAGIRELLVPPDLTLPSDADAADDIADAATPLAPGITARGRVEIDEDVDWYALTVPADRNTMTVELTGVPFVGASLTLRDDTGTDVPLEIATTPTASRATVIVEPGATYRLRVEQAPASVVFSYDTSGSMATYLPFVASALRAFSGDVTPGHEAIRIIPLQEASLLPDWSDDVYALRDAIAAAVFPGGSSAVEAALVEAAAEFTDRPGRRAMLVVTDAESSSSDRGTDLWQNLEAARSLMFSLHIGGGGAPRLSTHLMQDWVAANGGSYQYASSHAEVDRAFERLAAWLRRPADYGVSFDTAQVALEPGHISVAVAPGSAAPIVAGADVAIEVILDTSGSMLKKVGRQSRIAVAKAVLGDLVRDTLPLGAPLAVRVFGSRSDVCGTRLAVPLGPLDPEAVTALVDRIRVVQEADTPLGQAIAAVASDLASARGTRIVLLITDSEEIWPHRDLCRSDPADAIRGLAREGIEMRLNIVGFALTDRKAKTQMREWARLGNGAYFDAGDRSELAAGIARALAAPVEVYDRSEALVAQGTVGGGPITVPAGTYRVEVRSDPPATFPDVKVGPGAGTSLTIGEEAE